MKNTNLTTKALLGLLAFSSLNLIACVEVSEPVCASRLQDIPNLEGTYKFSLVDSKFSRSQQEFTIKQVGLGKYQVNGSEFQTCMIANKPVAETATAYGTYKLSILERSESGGLTLADFVVSKEDLTEAGIPFSIVEREQADHLLKAPKGLSRMLDEQAQKSKVLVIDSSAPNTWDTLNKSGTPQMFGFVGN